ncbi:MAG: phospholipase D family protein [Gammaproteobacteria bacterium]
MKIKINKTVCLLFMLWQITSCATVSFDQPKSTTHSFDNVSDTTIGKDVAEWVSEHGGNSGFYPLLEGMDALGVRLRLAEKAEKSLDLQYFLMKDDTAGAVMAQALLKAADRGVRVRFLLDDIFTTAPDRVLMLLNQHPRIQIRMFNPVSRSGSSSLNFLGDFKRANRRMHNKSFTVDNSISVVGGRNIADEYFQLKDDSLFLDLDIVAVGPVVPEISDSFDEFWNHSLAVPLEQFMKNKNHEQLDDFRIEIGEELNNIYDTVYNRAFQSHLLQDLFSGREQLIAAEARVLSDSPEKLTNSISTEQKRLAAELRQAIHLADAEIIFVTPYYVPGNRGVAFTRGLVNHGARVVVVTNSLASNNHVAVHSGYARYRRDVIDAGVELYEVRANAGPVKEGETEARQNLTLHTKIILLDRRQIFIGSLNIDPRSIEINSEMGLLIDSEDMVGQMAEAIDKSIAEIAYRVEINEDGKLEWRTTIDDKEVVETKEPLTSWWLRTKAWFLKIAPESQL